MDKYTLYRANMMHHQILPAGIHYAPLLNALASVPREIFVPKSSIEIAYGEIDHEIAENRWMYRPSVLAQLLNSLPLATFQKVLIIGGGLGYTAAILAKCVPTVIYLEEDKDLSQIAQNAFHVGTDFPKPLIFVGPLNHGLPLEAPYDCIFLEGAVEEIHESLFDQLTDQGMVVGILSKNPYLGQAVIIHKKNYRVEILFEFFMPVLPGFTREETFTW